MCQSFAPLPRRTFIQSAMASSLLLPGILSEMLAGAASGATAELPAAAGQPPLPHFPPKAKRVIFMFMSGGVSHVDTFDPKPELMARHGEEIKVDHPETNKRPGFERLYLKRPEWKFSRHGVSGTEVSELFPHVAGCVDDIAVIRSMHTDHSNHYNAVLGAHTGSFNASRPSIGSWTCYGLGSMNQNLPAFMVLAPKMPYAGGQVWAADFLPGEHQGTHVQPGAEPIANIQRHVSPARQRVELDALAALNGSHLAGRGADAELRARIESFETAFGMQMAVPEAMDLSHESDETHALYGLQRGNTNGFAWQCLVARRLAERGVRFIELIDTGSSGNWDSHGNMQEHVRLAKNVDQPMAGLLKDLKRRGMLEDTLVVWTTEFGRTPFNNSPTAAGREHHSWSYSSWMAGGGVKPGITYGTTDEFGIKVAENGVHMHDFHATILHLLGLNHERLTYRHNGRDYRLTDVSGNVVSALLA